jgi:DNA-binding NtrC family response regulator
MTGRTMNSPPKVLVVEDDRQNSQALKSLLSKWGYAVTDVFKGDDAIARGRRETFDVVLTDICMEGTDGLGVLKAFRQMQADTPVIVMTGFGSIDNAVEAMNGGAFNYISKPFEVDKIRLVISRALEQKAAARAAGTPPAAEPADASVRLIGHSPAMADLYRTIALTAMGRSTILLYGESGTGKELVARAIHQYSDRAKGNCVAINCAALPDTLLESELFGYARGAHSTAMKDKPGLVELAAGGTLFLDEVGDMSLDLQSKLLRLLEDSEVRRLGDNRTIRTDVRIIAATNKDLAARVREERFRSDLYYRLNVVTIVLPPLRDRKEDIPLLAEHFVRKYAAAAHKPVTGVAPEVLERFRRHDWPGNVRELENLIERAILLNTKTTIMIEDLPDAFAKPAPSTVACSLKDVERHQILEALEKTGRNVRAAAELLGISRRTVYRKAAEYGFDLVKNSTGP